MHLKSVREAEVASAVRESTRHCRISEWELGSPGLIPAFRERLAVIPLSGVATVWSLTAKEVCQVPGKGVDVGTSSAALSHGRSPAV